MSKDEQYTMMCRKYDSMKEENAQLRAELEKFKAGAFYLYGLLDDIDTAVDVFKPDTTSYSKYVNRKNRERFNVFQTDGYSLFDPVTGEKLQEVPEPPSEKAGEDE